MKCCCYLRHVQDLLTGGETSHEKRFGEPVKGRVIRFVWCNDNTILSQRKISQDSINLKERVAWNIPLMCIVCGGFRKGDNLVEDMEELEILDVSQIHARKLNAIEFFMSKNGEDFKFPITDGTVKLSGRPVCPNIHFNAGKKRKAQW